MRYLNLLPDNLGFRSGSIRFEAAVIQRGTDHDLVLSWHEHTAAAEARKQRLERRRTANSISVVTVTAYPVEILGST